MYSNIEIILYCYVNNYMFFITSSSRLENLSVAKVFYPIRVLGAEVNPKMPWNKSKAVPERYGPVPPDDYGGRLTREELFRI